MGQIFVLLTGGASFDVFCDPCFGAWPEVLPVDASDRFVSPGVTVDGTFMPDIHQFAFQPLVWWYNESMALGVPPEWFAWIVDAFDRVDAYPFFH
jgi:hypothetical protein